MEDVTKAPGRQERRRERTDSPCVFHYARSMPCASPRPAVPNVECRRANTLRWNVFRAVAARTTPRKNANFRGMSSGPCQKIDQFFFKENNVDFPEATRAGRRMLAGRTLLKNTQAPTDQGNGRAGRTLDREGSGNSSLSARPREGRRLFHPSIPKNRHGRPRAGRTPGFFRSARYPGAFASLRGRLARRRGRAGAPGLFVPCCGCAEARRETPKKSRPAGHRRPGRSREDLSTKIPA